MTDTYTECTSGNVCLLLFIIFFSIIRQPPTSALFPYTTLFRSGLDVGDLVGHAPLQRLGSELLGAEPLERRVARSEEHTSELQSRRELVCRLLLEKKKKKNNLYELTAPHSELPSFGLLFTSEDP